MMGLAICPDGPLILSYAGADGNGGLNTPQERRGMHDDPVSSLLVMASIGLGERVTVDGTLDEAIFADIG